MKKPRFKIGEWVRAKNTVKFDYDKNDNRIPFKHNGCNGVIIGATTRYIGKGNGYGHLYNTKPINVWQIRQGYSNKPYEALDEDVVSLENNLDDKNNNILLLKNDIPFRFNKEWHGINGYQNRQNFSRDSHDFDRDEKGRFI